MAKTFFSEFFRMRTLADLADSVNDSSGLYKDNSGGNSYLFKVKNIADL